MVRLLLIVLLLISTGCAGKEIVQVPISVPCPEPPVIEKQVWPEVQFIAPGDPNAAACLNEQNARNLLELVFKSKEYSLELEEALNAYRK